jgi:hypothetical protein
MVSLRLRMKADKTMKAADRVYLTWCSGASMNYLQHTNQPTQEDQDHCPDKLFRLFYRQVKIIMFNQTGHY